VGACGFREDKAAVYRQALDAMGIDSPMGLRAGVAGGGFTPAFLKEESGGKIPTAVAQLIVTKARETAGGGGGGSASTIVPLSPTGDALKWRKDASDVLLTGAHYWLVPSSVVASTSGESAIADAYENGPRQRPYKLKPPCSTSRPSWTGSTAPRGPTRWWCGAWTWRGRYHTRRPSGARPATPWYWSPGR
jgi:hypothetical protein